MKMILVKVYITIDAEENQPAIREQAEYAMNIACNYLEQHLKHSSISYKIREFEEI